MAKKTRITRLVMHGFKSFAKRTELEFSKDFNVIIGPNGSGKSNVLDALCFVLGKSGAKGLRAEKSANLIYNGGKKKQPSTKAEVSIFFDNHNKVFPLEGEEVKITRELKKNGQSNYKINDKKHTRQQILDLLRHGRINPDGYNIILQGDIVSFVEQSGGERRQIIEQIAGIDIYEEKKQKTMNELTKVEAKLKEAEILIAERETHLKELKKDRDQALKYKELEGNIHSYRATLLHRKHEGVITEKKKLDEQKAKIDSNIQKHKESLKSAREDIEKLRKQIDDITKEIERKGEKEQLQLQREVEELKVTITKKESRTQVIENEIEKIGQRRKQLKDEMDDIDKKISDVTGANEKLTNERERKEKEIEKVKQMIESFKKKHNIKEDSGFEEKLEELEAKSDKLQGELIEFKEKQQAMLREKDKIEYQLDGIKRQKEKVRELEKEHKKEIEEIKKKKDMFKNTIKDIEKLIVEDSNLAGRLSTIRKSIAQLSEDKNKAEAQLNSVRAKSTASKAVESIISNKRKFRGVQGTVMELISVSRQRAVAIEIAAGSRLNSIVVESDNVAKQCIEHLRSNKIGSATFLPMNKIKAPQDRPSASKHKGKDGVIGYARDIVKFDSKFLNVMKYVFGDTLVVRDIETARKLGIGTARFVTLDGDIIEASGAMSGGFRQRKGAAFSVSELAEKAEKLESQLVEHAEDAKKIEEQREALEDRLNKKKVEKAELEGEIIKSEKSLHIAGGDLDADTEKQNSLKKELESIDSELKEINSRTVKITKELTNVKIEKQKLKGKMSEMKNPRILAELSAFEQKNRELRERIIAIDAEMKSSQSRVKDMYSQEKERISRIMKQIDGEEKDFGKELEKITKELQKDYSDLEKKEKSASAFYEAFKELFKKRNDLSDMMRTAENQRDDSDNKLREEELKLNSLSLKLAEANANIAAIGEELNQYKDAKILKEEEASTSEVQSKIRAFEKMLEDLGNVNLKALDVYDEVEKQYKQLLEKKSSLEKEMESIMTLMKEIEHKKKELFMQTFEVVNENFKGFFSQLSAKGSAYLEVEIPEDPFAGGVFIKVNLSGKKYMDIRSLSGGEKTMTALAFIFSIQEHEPAPFYILDEVDAALDKKNSEKLGNMVAESNSKAQYVVITHNDVVISKSDTIYGVSMNEHGQSNVVGLKI